MLRTTLTRQTATRLFSTAPRLQKGPIETVKDAAKKVDRTVSDGLVAGINQTGAYHSSRKQVDSLVGVIAGYLKKDNKC